MVEVMLYEVIEESWMETANFKLVILFPRI
jgi:hypothetical protein